MVSLHAPVRIVILQHPSEQKHPLATVPILKACLSNLEVHVGSVFPEGLLSHLDLARCRVLFPNDNATIWDTSIEGAPLSVDAASRDAECDALIVLDGTWRKAKRMWFENPWLHAIPAVVIKAQESSHYRIRSSSVKGGLSTLETVTQACNYLSSSHSFDALMNPFEAMIDMQIKKMGIELFNAHYSSFDDEVD